MPTAQDILQLSQLLMPRQQGITLGGLTSPQGLLGLGLLGGSFLGKDEPGYVTEARQNIRNISNPQGYSNVFGNTVSGLQNQFLPLMQQQAQQGINQVAQRYKAAFPATAGLQGPEIGGLESYLRNQLVPTQQAFLGNLGLQGINQQQTAATKILELDRPDPFKEALSQLGGALILGSNGQNSLFGLGSGQGSGLLSGLLGGGGTGGAGGSGGLPGSFGGNAGFGQSVGNLLQLAGGNTPGGFFPNGIEQALSPAVATQLVSGLQSAFPAGTFSAGFGGLEPLGNGLYAVTQTSGQAVGVFNPATGMVTNAATGVSTPLTQTSGFTNFLGGTGSTMSGILGALGAAAAGGISGNLIGGLIPDSRAGGAAAGAAGGAAAGAIMGSVLPGIGTAIGAAIGALTGGAGGLFGSRSADHAFKAQRLAADQASQANNVAKFGSFWTAALGEAGYQNLNEWDALVRKQIADTPGGGSTYSAGGITVSDDQPNAMIRIGSQLLLREIQKTSPQITSLDQVPGFRQGYIDYIMQNLRIESGGSSVPIQNIGQAGGYITMAGLPGV